LYFCNINFFNLPTRNQDVH